MPGARRVGRSRRADARARLRAAEMASVYRPAYTRLDPTTGLRVPGKSPTWWAQYKGADGAYRRERGYTDRAATVALARKLEKRAARQAVGLVDEFEESAVRPIAEHLNDFERDLTARGNTTKHVQLLVGRARRLLKDAGIASIGELRGSALAEVLARYQRNGLGPQTRNFYLQSATSFSRWLVRERRLPNDPITHLRPVNVRTDRRHDRRAISAQDLQKLIAAAAASGKRFRGLRGVDRAMLYETASMTGLRVAELASLKAESFDLAVKPPTVTVEAGYSKRRRRDVLPLHAALAAKLKVWLAERRSAVPLWPGTWSERASRMVKRDLDVAEIAYRDASGVFDFHALRHQFLSALARSGVHPKAAQKLARHSTITLTMDRYSHLDLAELGDALKLVPHATAPAETRVATATPDAPLAHALAQTGVPDRQPLASPGNATPAGAPTDGGR
jgi:integrase